MKQALAALVVVAALAAIGVAAEAEASPYTRARAAVCHYFRSNCDYAMKVVSCETGGTYDPYARNGQYLGIFQMGSAERARFGHSNEVWGQARAAYAYYRLAGWSPWACA